MKISQRLAQQIVETVKDVCGKDINYIDTKGTIYASTDKGRIGEFHEIGQKVALTAETIEVVSNDSFFGTRAGVNIPILYDGELIAVIGISGIPDEVRKYAYLAQKITLLLLKEQELEKEHLSRKKLINYMTRQLLDAGTSRSSRVREYIRENRLDENLPCQVVLIRLSNRYNPNNIGMIENKILQMFRFFRSELYTFYYPQEYVLILEEKQLEQYYYVLEEFERKYRDFMKIAAGKAHPLTQQYQSFQEAKIALKCSEGEGIVRYDSLGLEILCSHAEEDERKAYLDKFLTPLSEEEIQLLTIYYQENMSLQATGKRLFIHKNTVQYKLDGIYRKTGYNPRVFKDAAGFYGALLLTRLL